MMYRREQDRPRKENKRNRCVPAMHRREQDRLGMCYFSISLRDQKWA
jgi:hypothetical protein